MPAKEPAKVVLTEEIPAVKLEEGMTIILGTYKWILVKYVLYQSDLVSVLGTVTDGGISREVMADWKNNFVLTIKLRPKP